MNRLLFAIPNWKMPSEVWAQRMIEQLQDDIALIAAYDAPKSWNDKIPAFRLGPPDKQRIMRRAVNKIRRQIVGPNNMSADLLKICRRLKINKILFNFATFPIQLNEFVNRIDAEIFVHCHGFDVAFDGRQDQWPHAPLHEREYALELVKLAQKVTYISNSNFTTQSLIAAGIPSTKIKQKYFGVESLEQFSPSDKKGRINILHLGRLVDCKGPDLTIRAFEIARANGLDAELVIAGDGPLMTTCEILRSRSKFADDIQILGSVSREQTKELFASADIFTLHSNRGVLTHREEAFGVTVIEAMGAGLPVVAGNAGAISESILDGQTGMLFMPGDCEAQAEGICELGKNLKLRNSMGKSGWLRVKEHFSLEQEREQLKFILSL